MSRNKNFKTSVTYQTICLDNCVVPAQLTVFQHLQPHKEQLMKDEQMNEINSFLQNIAEEVASGIKIDIGKINKLDGLKLYDNQYLTHTDSIYYLGKYVKFAYCITKASESEKLSLLVPKNGHVSKETRFRRVPACDYSIKASVYSLTTVEKEPPKTQKRVQILNDIFASIEAESPLHPPLEDELILHKTIQKMEEKNDNQRIIIDECERTRSESQDSNTDIENSRGLRLLTETEISSQFENWKGELIKIAKGKLTCKRHDDYKKGGPTKRQLDHQLYLTAFDETQIDWVLKCLKSIFITQNTNCDIAEPKEMDYIFRVLLPEFVARICMAVENISYDEAQRKLKFDYARDLKI